MLFCPLRNCEDLCCLTFDRIGVVKPTITSWRFQVCFSKNRLLVKYINVGIGFQTEFTDVAPTGVSCSDEGGHILSISEVWVCAELEEGGDHFGVS